MSQLDRAWGPILGESGRSSWLHAALEASTRECGRPEPAVKSLCRGKKTRLTRRKNVLKAFTITRIRGDWEVCVRKARAHEKFCSVMMLSIIDDEEMPPAVGSNYDRKGCSKLSKCGF